MKLNYDKLKKKYKKYNNFQTLAYNLMLDKVLNENNCKMHTMLMKSDFENYLILNKEFVYSIMKDEICDLSDFERFEKELNSSSGDKKS